MQEYNLEIKEALTIGLRPEYKIGLGSNGLVECTFMKPKPYGLRDCDDVTNPFETSQFDSWPFPQLIRGKNTTLLASATSLKEVTEESPYWTSADITTYDLNDSDTEKDITGSDIWHIADFNSFWMLFNGTSTVISLNKEGVFGETNSVYVQNSVAIKTGCEFHGRLMTGGFDASSYFSDNWEGVWQEWLDDLPYAIDTDLDDVKENFVMWSTIGGGDILDIFDVNSAISGLLTEADCDIRTATFMDRWRRNECGFMPMPWSGTVYAIVPLGNGVVVYGEDGIAYMPHVTSPYPTFGLQRLAHFGIAGRGAVCGTEQGHLFTDTSGVLWRLSASDLSMQKLGYEEFLDDLVDQDMIVSLDESKMNFYICGEDSESNALSYILTPSGLGKCPQQITGAYFAEGSLLGVFDTDESTEVVIVTDRLDFRYRDLKTITTIELGFEAASDTTVYVAVDYRYEVGNWTRSPWRLVNPQGWARIQMTALEFRLAIKFSTYTDTKLDYINVKWQASGKRTIRGLHADTANI